MVKSGSATIASWVQQVLFIITVMHIGVDISATNMLYYTVTTSKHACIWITFCLYANIHTTAWGWILAHTITLYCLNTYVDSWHYITIYDGYLWYQHTIVLWHSTSQSEKVNREWLHFMMSFVLGPKPSCLCGSIVYLCRVLNGYWQED